MHWVAIKLIRKKRSQQAVRLRRSSLFVFGLWISLFLSLSVLNEVKLLESVSHPNIIRLEEVIDSPDFLVLVLELAEGGELFDQMIKVILIHVKVKINLSLLIPGKRCGGVPCQDLLQADG